MAKFQIIIELSGKDLTEEDVEQIAYDLDDSIGDNEALGETWENVKKFNVFYEEL